MKKKESDLIIEALLFANAAPINQTKLNQVFDSPVPSLNNAIKRLNDFYIENERPYYINSIAGGYQLITNPNYDIWIRRLLVKSNKLTLSTAALDTLAIIAYKQPIGRYDIEAIRGVDSSGVVKTLLNGVRLCKRWIYCHMFSEYSDGSSLILYWIHGARARNILNK